MELKDDKELKQYLKDAKKLREEAVKNGKGKELLMATGFYTKSGKLKKQFRGEV